MAGETYQVWLGAEGCSKRGVRYRELSPPEVALVEKDAARSVGAGAALITYHSTIQTTGAGAMLVAYTDPLEPRLVAPADPKGKPTIEDPDLDDPKLAWRAVDPLVLERDGVALGGVFTSKDVSILGRLYNRLHEPTADEVAAVLGKARTPKKS